MSVGLFWPFPGVYCAAPETGGIRPCPIAGPTVRFDMGGHSMRLLSTVAVAGLAFATVLGTAGPAVAAAPSNDTYAGRAVVGSLPFTETLDTTEATTDADDADLMAASAPYCGSGLTTDASVWYQVTTAGGGIDLDM